MTEQQLEAMLEAQKPQEDPTLHDEEEFPSLGMEQPSQAQSNPKSSTPHQPAPPTQVSQLACYG